jgi:hypothetical protein
MLKAQTIVYLQSVRLSVPSSELGQPTPSPTRECCSPPPVEPRGETHSLAGEGVGGPNSDEGTATLVLYVYYNPSTAQRDVALTLNSGIAMRMYLRNSVVYCF